MFDLLLNEEHDLFITEDGDIMLTDSVRQAVNVRLLWFFAENRFFPDYGVPYFEEVLIKNPSRDRIRALIRTECLSVDGVNDVTNVDIRIDGKTRVAKITYTLIVGIERYDEEVVVKHALE